MARARAYPVVVSDALLAAHERARARAERISAG